jgi:hypothetical protein
MAGAIAKIQHALDRSRLPQAPADTSIGVTVEFVTLLRDESAWPGLVELTPKVGVWRTRWIAFTSIGTARVIKISTNSDVEPIAFGGL